MFEAIATMVKAMRKPTKICNSESLEQWRLEKAAELGYMTALYTIIGTNKNTWK